MNKMSQENHITCVSCGKQLTYENGKVVDYCPYCNAAISPKARLEYLAESSQPQKNAQEKPIKNLIGIGLLLIGLALVFVGMIEKEVSTAGIQLVSGIVFAVLAIAVMMYNSPETMDTQSEPQRSGKKASSLVLLANEQINATLKGEPFATSTDLIHNIFAKITKFLMFICGIRMTAQMTVTNKRVVLETKTFTLWCIPRAAAFKSIPYNGVASVEYAYEAQCICGLCRKYALTVTQTSGAGFGFVVKGGEDVAAKISNAIISNM